MHGFWSRMVGRMCCASLLLIIGTAGYGAPVAPQEDQGAPALPASQTQGTGQMRRAIPGVKLKKMEERLSLNPEQKKKMKTLTDAELGQMKALREDRTLTKEQRLERFRQIREASHDRIKEILTPEQRKKYEEIVAKGRRSREDRRQEQQEKPEAPGK